MSEREDQEVVEILRNLGMPSRFALAREIHRLLAVLAICKTNAEQQAEEIAQWKCVYNAMMGRYETQASKQTRQIHEDAEEIARLRAEMRGWLDQPHAVGDEQIRDALRAPGRAATMLGQPISEAERDAISKDGP